MKQELQQIADHLERINRDLHSESEVWDAELRDRQAKKKSRRWSHFVTTSCFSSLLN